MQGSLKLGTLAGIDIRAHYTWLFAFVLIAWSLAQGYFPARSLASASHILDPRGRLGIAAVRLGAVARARPLGPG